MTETTDLMNSQQISSLCKSLLPGQDDRNLLQKLQEMAGDYPVRLARRGDEWYRLGGVVDSQSNRIANDLSEWVERSYLECGQNFQTLLEHALEQQLIATKIVGSTLYFVVETGKSAEDCILFEIDKVFEVSDRYLVNEDNLPEDQEELIDPLDPAEIESFNFGHARYVYRRKTDVKLFMEALKSNHAEEHPVQRFIDEWNSSSASKAPFSKDWLVLPYQHTGQYGERQVNAKIINTRNERLPHLEDLVGLSGTNLHQLLTRFDRQAGYPFAWYFYMIKGKLVSPHSGHAVYKDLSGDFAYLPKRDEAILRDWVSTPYNV